jgi:mycothiol synthase
MRFRAPVPADAPAVLAVIAAREEADYGAPEYRLEDLRDEWRGSDLDLACDAQLVENDDGRIVAYAAVRRPGTFAVVAPEHEGRGIGCRLLAWAEGRERAHGRRLHRQWVAAANRRARELLTAAGYQHARSYWRMVRSVERVEPAPAPGLRLRPIDPARDAVSLHALDAASFAGAPDYEPESLSEFREEHFEAHDFAAPLSRVAERDGAIVGFLLARRRDREGVGYVDLLAVDPAHQRQGIGAALLRSAFAAFAQAGLRGAELMVASDNPRALRVYERVGMTIGRQSHVYERRVAERPRRRTALAASRSRWRAYRDVDAAGEPRSFADELDDIASVPFVAAEKRRSLELLELRAGDRVLDVGCGAGGELGTLAEIVGSGGRVVGVERSGALIAQARERDRARAEAIELVQGDAHALPFADGEFDACRADRTIQHLVRPEAALEEMVRVLRPARRVVVTESRWGLVAPSLDQTVTDRVLGAVASAAEQTDWVGDRLPAMFERAGLAGVHSLTTNYTTSGAEELFRFTQLRSAAGRAAQAGVLSEEQASAWVECLDDLVARGEAFAMVLILHVVGTKPAGSGGGTPRPRDEAGTEPEPAG